MTSTGAKMTGIVGQTPVNKRPALAKMTKPLVENDRRPYSPMNAVKVTRPNSPGPGARYESTGRGDIPSA